MKLYRVIKEWKKELNNLHFFIDENSKKYDTYEKSIRDRLINEKKIILLNYINLFFDEDQSIFRVAKRLNGINVSQFEKILSEKIQMNKTILERASLFNDNLSNEKIREYRKKIAEEKLIIRKKLKILKKYPRSIINIYNRLKTEHVIHSSFDVKIISEKKYYFFELKKKRIQHDINLYFKLIAENEFDLLTDNPNDLYNEMNAFFNIKEDLLSKNKLISSYLDKINVYKNNLSYLEEDKNYIESFVDNEENFQQSIISTFINFVVSEDLFHYYLMNIENEYPNTELVEHYASIIELEKLIDNINENCFNFFFPQINNFIYQNYRITKELRQYSGEDITLPIFSNFGYFNCKIIKDVKTLIDLMDKNELSEVIIFMNSLKIETQNDSFSYFNPSEMSKFLKPIEDFKNKKQA